MPWSSSLICCWTCWELGLYLASRLWKTKAEQLSCVSGALWVTKEGFGMCSRMPFFKCLRWMWIFFSLLDKAFQKRGLGGSHSESGWTWWGQSVELSYISSFHLQLPLIHDFTVLNSLKSCVNKLVGGHLQRLPCKSAQSTQSSIVVPLRSRTRPKSIHKLKIHFHSQKPLQIKRGLSFPFFNLSNKINHSDLWWK